MHRPNVSLSIFLFLAVAGQLAAADIAYREIFPSGPHAAANGWSFNHSDKAWDVAKDQGWGGAPGAGTAKAVNSLSEDEDDSEAWKGFVYLANGDRYILWTDEISFASDSVERVSVVYSAKDSAAMVRLAVRVGDAWYASEQTVSDALGAPLNDCTPSLFAVKDKNFIPFTWKPFESLPASVTGTAAALPAGAVTAFGFIGCGKNQTPSFDTVEVSTTHGVADATVRKK